MMVFYRAWFFSTSQHCCKDECKNIRATMSEYSGLVASLQIMLELLDEAE